MCHYTTAVAKQSALDFRRLIMCPTPTTVRHIVVTLLWFTLM